VNIDKQQILDLIQAQIGPERAAQADAELPQTVDTGRDSGLLEKYGIDINDLISRLPGGLGDKLGGLGL
jgi:hypothetical protein